MALLVFAVANALLLNHRSLWLDEFYTIGFSDPHAPFLHALTERIAADRAPPLYYVLVHFWMSVFGDGEIALRSLNLIGIGVLGLAMVYSRSLRWIGRTWLPFWILLLTSRYAWDFATEGRSYFLLFSGVTLLCFLVIDLLQRVDAEEPIDAVLLVGTGVTIFLIGALHYFGILFGGSAALVLLVAAVRKRRWTPATVFVLTGIAVVLSQGIWLIYSSPKMLPEINRNFWLAFEPVVAIKSFLIFTFSNNPVIPILAALAGYGVWKGVIKDGTLLGLIAIGALTFGAAFLISLKQPLLTSRYLIVLAPPLLLLVARFLTDAPQRWILPAAIASALVISLPMAVIKSLPSRENWRAASDHFEAKYAERCHQAVMMVTPNELAFDNFAVHRQLAQGRDWTLLPMSQAAVEAALASPCPVVAWAGNIPRERFDAALSALDFGKTRLRIVAFEQVYIAVRAEFDTRTR